MNRSKKPAAARPLWRSAVAQALLCTLILASAPAWAQDYSGLVQAKHDLLLSVSVPGVVTRVPVEVGRRVEAQQLLLLLDDQPQVIEVQRRQAISKDMAEMQSAQERVRVLTPLYEDTRKLAAQGAGVVSRDEVARLELEYSGALARVQQLQAQKRREQIELSAVEQERQLRSLKAPVGGVVTRVDVEIGEWAKPGDTLVQLVDASTCFVRLHVPFDKTRVLALGSKHSLGFDAATRLAPVQATVAYVASVVEPASGLVEVRLSFANPKLQVPPGIKASLRLDAVAAK